MKDIRVLIADDHPTYREGLYRLLNEQEDIDVVAVAEDGEAAVDKTKELLPDVAILDIAMPKLNGLDATMQIKASCTSVVVLLLSAYDYESYIISAIRAGASGYCLKSIHLYELISAIRGIFEGQQYFDPVIVRKVIERISNMGDRQGSITGLSNRQLQIIKLASKGNSSKDIARQLSISERTVHVHLNHIYKKLNVSSRSEAVFYALNEGLIDIVDILDMTT